MVRWTPELVIEEMEKLGMKGSSGVNSSNFEKYARKVRSEKRSRFGTSKESPEGISAEEEIQPETRKIEEKKAIISKAEKRKERKERKKEEMREAIIASVQKNPQESSASQQIALLPPDIPPEKVKTMSMKELRAYYIDPEVHRYIIYLGPSGYRRVISARIMVKGVSHRVNETMYAFSLELGKEILSRKLGVLVRELVEKRSDREEEGSKTASFGSSESEKEERRRERRAERRKSRKKMQIISGGPRREFKEKPV